MECNFHKLLGLPLDLIVLCLEEFEYSDLYAAGDKVLNARIRKCPLVCRWKPSSYSDNVVAIEETHISDVYDNEGKVCFTNLDMRGHEGGYFPPTLTKLGISFWEETYKYAIPHLNSVLDMKVEFTDLLDMSDPFAGFPKNLTRLEIKYWDTRMITTFPSTLTTLVLGDERCDDQSRNDSIFCDLSQLNLENFKCWAHDALFTYPSTLVHFDGRSIIGYFPDLKTANTHHIEGTFPSLEKVFTFSGDFSGIPRSCYITQGGRKDQLYSWMDDVIFVRRTTYGYPDVKCKTLIMKIAPDCPYRFVRRLRKIGANKFSFIKNISYNGVIPEMVEDISLTPIDSSHKKYMQDPEVEWIW